MVEEKQEEAYFTQGKIGLKMGILHLRRLKSEKNPKFGSQKNQLF